MDQKFYHSFLQNIGQQTLIMFLFHTEEKDLIMEVTRLKIRKRNLRRNNVQSYNHISLRKKFLFHCLVSFICVLNLRILKTIQYQTREIKCGYRGLKFD